MRWLPSQTLLALSLLCLAGCNHAAPLPVSPVTGTLRVDGQPTGNVLVTFTPDPTRQSPGPSGAGVTDAQGAFTLRTEDGRAGCGRGWHLVQLEDLALYDLPRGDEPPPKPIAQISRVPLRYRQVHTSKLSQQVGEGTQTVTLNISSAVTSTP